MDLLSGLNTTKTARMITRSIGDFRLDCVTTENHESGLRVTENPIESGAAIADHSVLEPKEITVTGVMVGYEPPQQLKSVIGGDAAIPDSYPLPMEVKAITAQAEAMANRYIALADNLKTQSERVIAPWYPAGPGLGKDSSQTADRAGKAYNDLLTLQKKGETLTVQTGLRQYQNMLIVSVSVTQTHDGSAEFSIRLREIFIVETQTAQGSYPDLTSSAKKKHRGKTQPKEAKRSVLRGITA